MGEVSLPWRSAAQRQHRQQRQWLFAMAGVSLAAVAVALVSQHVFDMRPCPWCILQRLVFLVIAALSVGAALSSPPLLRRVLTAAAALSACAGLATALYQHFVAAHSQSCNLTLADRIISGLALDHALPSVFAVQASCADAAVALAGMPYEFWSGLLFAALAAAAAYSLRPVRS